MKKTYGVSGMYCDACQILIERKLSHIKGVASVRASTASQSVLVEMDKKNSPSLASLNKAVKEFGYTISESPVLGKTTPLSMEVVSQALLIIVTFGFAFFLLDRIGLTSSLSVTKDSSFSTFFLFGLIAGLSSCAALVGGLLLALSSKWKSKTKPFILFNTGRLLSFAFFGALLGFVGAFFHFSLFVNSFIVIAVSLFMLFMGLRMVGVPFLNKISLKAPSWASQRLFSSNAFLVGALTFFVPCGFTAIAQAGAFAMGNAAQSALALFAFALGTLPMLAFLSFASVAMYKNPSRAAAFSLAAGVLVIGFSLMTLFNQVKLLPTLSQNTAIVKKGEVRNVTIEAKGFNYYPRELTLSQGVPVRLTVKNSGAVGCAQAMSLPGLYPKTVYLTDKETKVEFVPDKKGTFAISCSMGMVDPIKVVVL